LRSTSDVGDLPDVRRRDFAALVAQALAHRRPEVRRVDELHLAPARRRLAVREHPHVGRDAGVVEKLLRQRHQRVEPVIFEDPPADFALAAAGVPGEQRRAVHHDGDVAAALARRVHAREHVLQEEQLPVADTRRPRPEAACVALARLRFDVGFVHLPVFAVWRVGEQVVKELAGMQVVRQRAAVEDVLGVAAVGAFHVQVGLADRVGFRVDLLAEQVHLGLRVDLKHALLRDGQHAAGPAARVVDRAHDVRRLERFLVVGQQQVHHQPDNLARGEVLAGVFVQRLVEFADQFFEDVAHLQVGDLIGVQVDLAETLHHQEEQPALVEVGDGAVEVQLRQHVAHVRAEAVHVLAQVVRDVVRVGQQAREVVARDVVEGEPGFGFEQVRQCAFLQPGCILPVRFEDGCFGWREHAVQAAQHREGEDHVLVVAAFEGVTDQVGYRPDEVRLFAEVVHAVVFSLPGGVTRCTLVIGRRDDCWFETDVL
jgi:hypothetical protein